jgi:putative phosphoesterase
MLIAILADTHLPLGSRGLPGTCIDHLEEADLILHAGDLKTIAVLEELQTYGEVVAVRGNVDDAEVRAALPRAATITFADGRGIALIHDAGPAKGRLDRLRRQFPGAQAVVFGHSHMPLHERAPDGFQIFNPGSPTQRRRAPHHTMGLARVSKGSIEFELIVLG